MRYQFSAEHRHEYAIPIMCRVLSVEVLGYYAWSKRPPSQHSREDAQLAEQVKTAFQANRRVYGSPRIHAELHAQGMHGARDLGGSSDASTRAFCTTPTSSHDHHTQ